MEQLFNNLITIIQNGFITFWYWCNMYRWEILFFIGMVIAVNFEYKEMKIHYINDNRKVI